MCEGGREKKRGLYILLIFRRPVFTQVKAVRGGGRTKWPPLGALLSFTPIHTHAAVSEQHNPAKYISQRGYVAKRGKNLLCSGAVFTIPIHPIADSDRGGLCWTDPTKRSLCVCERECV